jgi:predicted transcriptional regulator of viral defense system
MKAAAWREFLGEQNRRHGKVLFSVTELANAARVSRSALNVALSRLRRQGVIERYAHGRYGMPDAVTPEALLAAIDSHAYITGMYALYGYNMVAQSSSRIVCFTDRRSPRARERKTPVGRFVFVCVRSSVYAPPAGAVVAPPEQALCDYVYLLRRAGVRAAGQATFRNLERMEMPELERVLERYPSTVAGEVRGLVCFSLT